MKINIVQVLEKKKSQEQEQEQEEKAAIEVRFTCILEVIK